MSIPILRIRGQDGQMHEVLAIRGAPGETPDLDTIVQAVLDKLHIGENGNWFLGDVDTGTRATGENGESAYTSAQNGGYTGTQSEFYADLAALDSLAAWFAEL